jgi:hypothetical protein
LKKESVSVQRIIIGKAIIYPRGQEDRERLEGICPLLVSLAVEKVKDIIGTETQEIMNLTISVIYAGDAI